MTNIEAMKLALEALYDIDATGVPVGHIDLVIDALRTAIAEAEKQEPVAWIQPNHLQQARRAPFQCRVEPTKRMSDFIPIYTTPPAAQRQPLTEERVWELAANCLDSVAGRLQFARAIEAAHGIKGAS